MREYVGLFGTARVKTYFLCWEINFPYQNWQFVKSVTFCNFLYKKYLVNAWLIVFCTLMCRIVKIYFENSKGWITLWIDGDNCRIYSAIKHSQLILWRRLLKPHGFQLLYAPIVKVHPVTAFHGRQFLSFYFHGWTLSTTCASNVLKSFTRKFKRHYKFLLEDIHWLRLPV